MPPRILILAALLSTPLHAAEGMITDAEIRSLLDEQEKAGREILGQKGKPEDFLRIYQRYAESERPPRERAKYVYLLGRAQFILDRKSDAQREYERALLLHASFPRVHLALCVLAERAGDLAAARRQAEAALELLPRYAEAFVALGRIHSQYQPQDLVRALACFEKAVTLDPTPEALVGLMRVRMALYHETFDEAKKKEHGDKALALARQYQLLDQRDPRPYWALADLLLQLDRPKEAVAALEQGYAADVPEESKPLCLEMLQRVYLQLARISREYEKNLLETLRRMLKHALSADRRAEVEKKIRDMEEKGGLAFPIWEIERRLEALNNEGKPLDERLEALAFVVGALEQDYGVFEPSLQQIRRQMFENLVRVLTKGPPPLTIKVLEYFRRSRPDPMLLGILVLFVYPLNDAQRTPAVRLEAVRTIAEVAGVAAYPILWRCLEDDDGAVQREVDRTLSRITDERSPLDEAVTPLTPDESLRSRKFWKSYLTSEAGAKKLILAMERLRSCVRTNDETIRRQQSAPLADVLILLVLNNDLPFPAWKAVFQFFSEYLGQPFRAPEKRKLPLEEAERPAIWKLVDDFYRGK